MNVRNLDPDRVMNTALTELARPFPPRFIEHKDGQDYVAHHIINQRLLSVVGPFNFEVVQVVRGDVPAVPPDPQAKSRRGKAGTPALHNVVVGGIWRLTSTVDGREVRVEEVGDCGDVHNWAHDGARLKDAASDAIKRCAMRLGLGLHLWAQEHYFLDIQLANQSGAGSRMHTSATTDASPAPAPTSEGPATRTDEAPGQPGRHRGRPSDTNVPTPPPGPGDRGGVEGANQAAAGLPPSGTEAPEGSERPPVRPSGATNHMTRKRARPVALLGKDVAGRVQPTIEEAERADRDAWERDHADERGRR